MVESLAVSKRSTRILLLHLPNGYLTRLRSHQIDSIINVVFVISVILQLCLINRDIYLLILRLLCCLLLLGCLRLIIGSACGCYAQIYLASIYFDHGLRW